MVSLLHFWSFRSDGGFGLRWRWDGSSCGRRAGRCRGVMWYRLTPFWSWIWNGLVLKFLCYTGCLCFIRGPWLPPSFTLIEGCPGIDCVIDFSRSDGWLILQTFQSVNYSPNMSEILTRPCQFCTVIQPKSNPIAIFWLDQMTDIPSSFIDWPKYVPWKYQPYRWWWFFCFRLEVPLDCRESAQRRWQLFWWVWFDGNVDWFPSIDQKNILDTWKLRKF